MRELCSCGAELEITDVTGWSAEAIREAFTDWRDNHRHEFAPAFAEPPLIHESGSSHERLGDEYPIQDRGLVGFQRNA